MALSVLAGGALLLFGSAKKWSSQTTVMVLPSQGIAIGPSASYWDTLSRGQITSTVAQVLALPRFKDLAGHELDLSRAEVAGISISATQVTGTALVTITAKGPNATDSANMADAVVAQADSTVNALIAPYSVTVVSQSDGNASPSGTSSSSKYLVILAVVAVALGFGVQQGLSQLFAATSRPRRGPQGEPTGAGAGAMDGPRANGQGPGGVHGPKRADVSPTPDLLELATTPDDMPSR